MYMFTQYRGLSVLRKIQTVGSSNLVTVNAGTIWIYTFKMIQSEYACINSDGVAMTSTYSFLEPFLESKQLRFCLIISHHGCLRTMFHKLPLQLNNEFIHGFRNTAISIRHWDVELRTVQLLRQSSPFTVTDFPHRQQVTFVRNHYSRDLLTPLFDQHVFESARVLITWLVCDGVDEHEPVAPFDVVLLVFCAVLKHKTPYYFKYLF